MKSVSDDRTICREEKNITFLKGLKDHCLPPPRSRNSAVSFIRSETSTHWYSLILFFQSSDAALKEEGKQIKIFVIMEVVDINKIEFEGFYRESLQF